MKNEKYNIAIIGAGAAGMIAAGHAAELGSRVVLLEKNQHAGRKLLITGKGRCNITNADNDLRRMISMFGKNGRFLHHAFGRFSNKDVVEFFENHGLRTKVERGMRVFPASDNAQKVVDCLMKYLKDNNADVKFGSPVEKIITSINSRNKTRIEKVVLRNGEEIIADNFLFASGGKSYPRTGSTGDAYKWLKQIGHTVIEPNPALTPIIVRENVVKQLAGLVLKNVEISLWQTRKLDSRFGEALFTDNGLSGPIVLDLSKNIGKNMADGLKIRIDFKPTLDYPTLHRRIQRDLDEQNNRHFKNSLNKLLPMKLIPVIIELSGIKEDKKANEVTKIERKRLAQLLKCFELSVKGLVGFEAAIITSGGVDLKEVDRKTMKSKVIDNLYFAGEILDIDGPTGGYNLQVAWSTGYLAGAMNFGSEDS
ncbi:MAG: NAD(P)/FAD-dependent oxidoreductase [Candidatus Delongbacteria bacterium]|nr:NAD(P)/FAD-dependent oxidoreductase [Candidatus Delongbacteria bacterium]